ncbi:hypothetical protein ACNOYE_22975 [Nannocystaceae bacterium ST9]
MTTQWDRIEPHTRSDALDEGLQARIADPLWMLARQWQLGEFRGEDAATPVHVHLRAASNRLETLDSLANGKPEPFASGVPLEARVEAESILDAPGRLALALEAGLAWLRRMDQAGLASLRPNMRKVFPLKLDEVELRGLPHAEQQRLKLWSRRAIDGIALLAATAQQLAAAVPNPAAQAQLQPIYQAWRAEQLARFVMPGASGSCWRDDRLEYAFSVGARTGLGELVLAAKEYDGARLDWWSFDVDASVGSHGLSGKPPDIRELDVLPVPLRYPGMPASRWWEFEEGSVDFGKLESGPTDLARMIVAEFATIYSDDWWLIPLRLPVGSLGRVLGLEVIDSFGGRHAIRSTAFGDRAATPRPFALFELAGDDSLTKGFDPWLLIPPALVGSLTGEDLERVGFVRDEAANMAWAIEEVIESPTGRALRRRLQWALASGKPEASEPNASTPARADEDAPWKWTLQSEVPPHWVPMVPEAIGASGQIQLRRGRMLGWDVLPAELQGLVGARGRLLAPKPARAVRLHEEELPRGGLEVARHWQRARGSDGRVITWLARRKRPGAGERGSGLRFDTIE